MRGVRGTDGVSFCWQDKERLELIRRMVPGRKGASAQLVYLVLTNLASDERDSRFFTYTSTIAQMAHVSRWTAADALGQLERLKLISLSDQLRLKNGKYAAMRVVIAKGKSRGENVSGLPPRHEAHLQAKVHRRMASVSDGRRGGKQGGFSPYTVEVEEDREVVVARANEEDDQPIPNTTMIPARIKTIIEEYLGPLCWNGTNVRLVTEWCASDGESNVIRAIEDAALSNVARGRLLLYVRATLENQRKLGFTWLPKESPKGGLVEIPNPLGA